MKRSAKETAGAIAQAIAKIRKEIKNEKDLNVINKCIKSISKDNKLDLEHIMRVMGRILPKKLKKKNATKK